MFRVLFLVTFMLLMFFSVANAQEIDNPDEQIVRCASVMCTDPLYFFDYRVYIPVVGK